MYEKAEQIARECGFTHIARLDCGTLALLDEVRDMCKVNTCGKYGSSASCPPACGTLEECRERIKPYRWGIILQNVGELEDSLDIEGIQETAQKHKEMFHACCLKLRELFPGMLAMGAGGCSVCAQCVGPGEPCRFPERRASPPEAYGLLISDVCKDNGLKYYYGPNTIAYTSCCLLG